MPEAFDHRLRVVRPLLPEQVDWIELHGLSVGRARADLRFERAGNNRVHVKALRVEGKLDVVPETGDTTLIEGPCPARARSR